MMAAMSRMMPNRSLINHLSFVFPFCGYLIKSVPCSYNLLSKQQVCDVKIEAECSSKPKYNSPEVAYGKMIHWCCTFIFPC